VQMSMNDVKGWNFFFTGWGTQPALGGLSVMQFFAQPIPVYFPPKGHPDPELLKLWNEMNTLPNDDARQQAFAEMQKYTLDQVYALPFGSLTKVQAVRSDVKGFVPFRIPRMYDVWFQK
jgi:peptide/nickel transport system substrate-binding protein